jgi:fumarate reductase flavoprotein subunit
VTDTISTDILIVGGGLSGLACAVQAQVNGDDFILLEGQQTLGGNGQGVEGTFAVDSKYQKAQNITVDRSVIMQEELGKTQWVTNGLFYKDLMDNAATNLEWLVDDCGCSLSGLIDNYPIGAMAGNVNTFHWWADGAANIGYVQPMQQKLYNGGADIRLNNRGLEFSYDDAGKVNGVYAVDAFGDLVQYQAKIVVVATGGFGNDDRRVAKHGFDLDTLERIGMPGHYGDGINMVLAAGASEFDGVCYLKYNRAGHEVESFGPLWTALCFGGPFLWVNQDCERFVDEGMAFRVMNTITQSAPVHNQGGGCFCLFDQNILTKQFTDNKDMADQWKDDLNAQWSKMISDKDDAYQANTIEDLATQIGVDPTALKAAVDDYNSNCAAGVDSLYGKDPQYLMPIQTAPFYCAKYHEAMEGPLGGVVINRKFQPVLEKGGTLDNVNVIGLDGMMLYRDVYPMDVPGTASAECIHGGRVAANEAHAALAA